MRKIKNQRPAPKQRPQSEVQIVNLSTYTSPKIKEVRGKEWVSYGEDNNYYQYLIDRYNGSPTNNAAINGLSEMIYGKGLDATDSNRKPNEYAQMMSLLKKDCVRKLVYDLKLMGSCAMQIIYSKDRTKVAQVEHFPIETLRAEKCNEEGDIEAYYYFKDWTSIKPTDEPKRIPCFGYSRESIEIYVVKPYRAGFYYYSPVDYQGGLQYSELEEEISNYHLNNILNGLAPSMLINFNNGVPNEEQRRLIENRIYEKFSGSSNAGKFILSFNDNADAQANIEPVQLSDAHNQYQFLSDESARKILVSHRIVSPMLLGIKDNTGLGNNADELKTASILMDNTVIRPFQTLLIDAFDQILAYNSISLNLYFKTLQPLEFTDLDNVVDEETREEETGVKMSKQVCLSNDQVFEALSELGEDEDLENWILVDERQVDYDQEEALDKMIGLASTGVARPNAKSDQDTQVGDKKFKVRYQYAPLEFDSQSRDFCSKMVRAAKIYRKEDIIAMGKKTGKDAVNAGWGPNGDDAYDIWLYKGGGSCRHFWMRKTYMAIDVAPDVKNPNAEISVNEARSEGLKPEKNDAKVAKRTRDQENRGFLKPKNWKTKQDKAFD
jgi:hypothetical protein